MITFFHYSTRDWVEDCAWVSSKHDELAEGEAIDWCMLTAYFERKYGPTASSHRDRTMAAIVYLSRHIEDFNEGMHCIACNGGGMFAQPVLLALRIICTRVTEDELGTDWPVGDVKLMATAIARFPVEAARI